MKGAGRTIWRAKPIVDHRGGGNCGLDEMAAAVVEGEGFPRARKRELPRSRRGRGLPSAMRRLLLFEGRTSEPRRRRKKGPDVRAVSRTGPGFFSISSEGPLQVLIQHPPGDYSGFHRVLFSGMVLPFSGTTQTSGRPSGCSPGPPPSAAGAFLARRFRRSSPDPLSPMSHVPVAVHGWATVCTVRWRRSLVEWQRKHRRRQDSREGPRIGSGKNSRGEKRREGLEQSHAKQPAKTPLCRLRAFAIASRRAAKRKVEDSAKPEIAALRQQLAAARKDSSTSSKPPSSDIVKTQGPPSLRTAPSVTSAVSPSIPSTKREAFPLKSRVPPLLRTHPRRPVPVCGRSLASKRPLRQDRPTGGRSQSPPFGRRATHQSRVLVRPLRQGLHGPHAFPHPARAAWVGAETGPPLIAFMKGVCHASFSTVRLFLRDRGPRHHLAQPVEQHPRQGGPRPLDGPYEELLALLPDEPFAQRPMRPDTKNNGERWWTWCLRAEFVHPVSHRPAPQRRCVDGPSWARSSRASSAATISGAYKTLTCAECGRPIGSFLPGASGSAT